MKTAKKTTTAPPALKLATVADAIRADLAAGDAGYRAAGEKFLAQRAALGRGAWLAWLKAEGFSRSTTYRYMGFAKLPTSGKLETFAEFCHPDESDSYSEGQERLEKPRPLDEIAADLRGMGLKKADAPEPESITCKACGEIYSKGGLNKHIDKGCGPKVELESEADTEEEITEESTQKIIAGLRQYVGRSVGFLEARALTQEQIGQLMGVRDRLDAVIERLLVVAS
jgi:hypothetical protein